MHRFVLALVLVIPATVAVAQERIMAYGPTGQHVGTVIKRGNYGVHYNPDGSSTRTFISRGNVSTAYDPNGRVTGYGIRRGNVLTYYDRNGHPTGSRAAYNSDNSIARIYDRKGRYKGSVVR
jgi:hypothetical protein